MKFLFLKSLYEWQPLVLEFKRVGTSQVISQTYKQWRDKKVIPRNSKLTSKSIMSQTNYQRPLQESINYKKAMKKNETTYTSQQHLIHRIRCISNAHF